MAAAHDAPALNVNKGGVMHGVSPLQSLVQALLCIVMALDGRQLCLFFSFTMAPFVSDTLNDSCNALADTDAHGAQGVAPAGTLQLIHRGGDQARAAHAKRVAECNRATVRIKAWVVVGDTQFTQHRQTLR